MHRRYKGIDTARVIFALPLMCAGELSWKIKEKNYLMLLITGILLLVEITAVGLHTGSDTDRSMYILLPPFILFLVVAFREWDCKINCKYLAGISSAIYVMQFGIITAGMSILGKTPLTGSAATWVVYIAVLSVPAIVYLVLSKTKIVKILF